MRRNAWSRYLVGVLASALVLTACNGGGVDESGADEGADTADDGADAADDGADTADGEANGAGEPQSGGELTVLLDAGFAGDWSTGLDPATSNSTGANLPQNHAIFGGLFTLEPNVDGDAAGIVPHQAESYEWSDDALTLTVNIREGIEFTDGTPMDADAVVWNWVRNLSSGSTGAPILDLDLEREPPDLDQEFLDSLFDALPEDVDEDTIMARLGAMQAVDDLTVELYLTGPDGSLVNGFPGSNLNLIVSPTAYAEVGGEEFSQRPVAAGPFVITSNQQNERLEVERNENYFKDGLPYLDALTFQSVSGDQVLYQTLLAGQGDVIEGLSATALIEEADNNPDVEVHLGAPTSPYVVQLNTRQPPFDDIRARQAIYHASDWESINQGLFNGEGEMSQSFTGSGGLFHHPEVPGYPEYDPEAARALVEELGGLSVTFGTIDLVTARSVTTALQTQWQEAGIDVEIDAVPLGDLINNFLSGEWESMLQTAGAWDPSVGIGVGVRFGSTSPFSGTPLPEGASSAQEAIEQGLSTELDELLEASVATVDPDEREAAYREISQKIAEEAYGPFGMAFSPAQVIRQGVHGPGLDVPIPALAVNQGVLYDRVWVENGE